MKRRHSPHPFRIPPSLFHHSFREDPANDRPATDRPVPRGVGGYVAHDLSLPWDHGARDSRYHRESRISHGGYRFPGNRCLHRLLRVPLPHRATGPGETCRLRGFCPLPGVRLLPGHLRMPGRVRCGTIRGFFFRSVSFFPQRAPCSRTRSVSGQQLVGPARLQSIPKLPSGKRDFSSLVSWTISPPAPPIPGRRASWGRKTDRVLDEAARLLPGTDSAERGVPRDS